MASVLAARVGLERVIAIDDHTADEIGDKAGPRLAEVLNGMWLVDALKALK